MLACLGSRSHALMVVSFCVFSVSTLLVNSLGDDVSSDFQFVAVPQ